MSISAFTHLPIRDRQTCSVCLCGLVVINGRRAEFPCTIEMGLEAANVPTRAHVLHALTPL
ncbi:hypothetical protein BO86DRAFT_385838 [Aspergillus japonicus CBS 114.51]|uniref:Uncharacterized protein n=1 Tax=Aspergillus japonicus CBS 114.51 TaxID=1448312 RepID=A0A8T8XCH0_ASPJA|nr:hypothetical protein BO86DRAFT_385838 [Aspergillus japonicus CBS 114.51]RAH85524.1 hypothetical protein BO86DRAFT_385838 [Aspergillus japonicus CBS 114.51]